MNRVSENQLINQCRQGNNQAFDALAERYRYKVMACVSRYVHERAAIHDVTQETLLRAFVGLPRFQGHCQFYTWLYRIAVNTAKNYAIRTAKHTVEVDIDNKTIAYQVMTATTQASTDPSMDPCDICENDEFTQAIEKAIAALPTALKQTLRLKETEHLDYKQIATKMRCPQGTVRSRLFRAREMVVEGAIDHLYHHQVAPVKAALVMMQRIRVNQRRHTRKN